MTIQVKNLSKKFGRRKAVSNISFSVKSGEIVGFLGPNGAGKTTTLRMLTGYLKPNSGSIKINGDSIDVHPLEAKNSIGYLPEHSPLYNEMKVKEYLNFRCQLKGLAGEEKSSEVSRAMEICQLLPQRNQLIQSLSKGYRQRVGLAAALLASPPLLILDEPTSGLDPRQIRQIRQIISDLGGNHTIVLSTHILSEIEMICNRIILINEGEIRADSSPKELSASLRTASQILIEIKGDEKLIKETLSQLEYVRKVDSSSSNDEWLRLSIYINSTIDAREPIIQTIIKNNWPFRSIYQKEASLEEAFVELTQSD